MRNSAEQSWRRDEKQRRAGKVRLAVWVDAEVHHEIGETARVLGLTLSQATERIVRRDRERKSGGRR